MRNTVILEKLGAYLEQKGPLQNCVKQDVLGKSYLLCDTLDFGMSSIVFFEKKTKLWLKMSLCSTRIYDATINDALRNKILVLINLRKRRQLIYNYLNEKLQKS